MYLGVIKYILIKGIGDVGDIRQLITCEKAEVLHKTTLNMKQYIFPFYELNWDSTIYFPDWKEADREHSYSKLH